MSRRKSHNVLTLARKRAKDAAKTIEANSSGGRYYVPTTADKIRKAFPNPFQKP